MPNPYHSEFKEPSDVKTPGAVPDKRPAAPPATGSRTNYKMPKTPGPARRVHKVLGRRVRTMARENF